jgi:hypothetical protein
LLDALRKKRAVANAIEVDSTAVRNMPEVKLLESEVGQRSEELVESADTVEEVEATPVAPAAKKGRPSMPSWDEIVFGTKTDD